MAEVITAEFSQEIPIQKAHKSTIPVGKLYYYPHLTDEETEAEAALPDQGHIASEVSQAEKQKYHTIALMCRIFHHQSHP